MKAIINAKIYTVTKGVIEKGAVLYDGGTILEVGSDIGIPASAEKIDASGLLLTPGLIDVHTHMFLMHGHETMPGHQDYNEGIDASTPQIRALDALNPFDAALEPVRAAGFTTCYTGPGSANVIGGRGCSFKLRGRTADEMFIEGSEQMKMALGENPKRFYGLNGKSPVTRMGSAAIAREYFNKAIEYADKKDAGKEPAYDAKLEALVPVVRGQMKVRIHSHQADDIATALRLAKEYKLPFAIEHCTEGWKIADVLAEADAWCVVGPLLVPPVKKELWGARLETAGILDAAGAHVCLTADGGWDTQFLPSYAGFAIRRGLSWDSALKALTINPATVMGLEKRVGSLEPGKDADFALWNGDPFCNYSECVMTVIDGETLSYRR